MEGQLADYGVEQAPLKHRVGDPVKGQIVHQQIWLRHGRAFMRRPIRVHLPCQGGELGGQGLQLVDAAADCVPVLVGDRALAAGRWLLLHAALHVAAADLEKQPDNKQASEQSTHTRNKPYVDNNNNNCRHNARSQIDPAYSDLHIQEIS